MIRLEPDDPRVRTQTALALQDCVSRKPSLTIRCEVCRAPLAHAGLTDYGYLFTSSWEVERPEPTRTFVNGRELRPREARAYEAKYVVERSGDPDKPLRDGVIAIPLLPPRLPQDYPDLMVRCADDGDGLLDRSSVVTWLVRGLKEVTFAVSFPRLEYRPSDPTFADELGVPRKTKLVKRFGSREPRTE